MNTRHDVKRPKRIGSFKRPITQCIMFALALQLPSFVAFATPSIILSTVPLQLTVPTHPRVLFALGNSQSMDGTLSGAIMLGSGMLSSGFSSLQNSSSPLNYTVPAGFTPPLQAANASGQAPYTVNQSGTLYDNGASRLNVAKAGVQAIIEAYMPNTDFALEVYNTSNTGRFTTWVYYMSPQTGSFTFTNTPVAGNRYVANPCYNYLTASANIRSNCTSLASVYTSNVLATNQYLVIGSSSDDPTINDVLYAGGQPGIFMSYNGPTPASPYPPFFTLSNYNSGSVLLRYRNTSPSVGSFASGPTNAGFAPYSPQVMYAQRGFGYGGQQSATIGNVIVPMTSAGSSPTTASINTAINKFLPLLKPETNVISSTEIKAVAGQAPISGLLTTAKTYLTGLPSVGCKPQLNVILISDGLPTLDMSGKSWPPLGSAAAIGYGVTATFNADGSLAATNDQALIDTLTSLTNLTNANIQTYVIGLGAGVDPSINPDAAATLTAMALAGGTKNYYPANDPNSLVNELNNILISVQNGSLSTTSAAISSTKLQVGTVEFQASFSSSDKKYQDWTGNISQISLDSITGFPTGTIMWSAQSLLDAQVSRIIATWDPLLNNGAGGGAPFQWASINDTQKAQLQPSDALGANRLLYLRGNTSLEKRNGGAFRNRTHILGDLVNSQPSYVGQPSNSSLYSSPGYVAFSQAHSSRPSMIYVGANDGMLHAFDATTGNEKFAFVPNAVFGNLFELASPLYNQSHMFFVDGSPQSGDVQFADASWHTVLLGGQNSGGKSIYALDITDPQNINSETALANAVLWEFTEADMGFTYSQPQIGLISSPDNTKKFAAFFGNGYNSPNNKAMVYAVNPENGQLIRKIDLCAAVPGSCNPTLPQGLSTVALGQQDGLQGEPITQVYVGDLQGNLWAIDVSSSNPLLWQARRLFQARDANNAIQPITTTPLVTLNPSYPRFSGLFVMFGTGQLLTSTDLTSTQTQTIYGIWDRPNSTTVINRNNLQSQTLNLVTTATSGLPQDILTTTTNAIAWGNTFGWYTDLPIPGQRVITNPQLINGAFIATLNTPPATPCGVASSMFLDIFYETGGAFPNFQLDIDQSGTLTMADVYNGTNPVGLGLIPGWASSPAPVGLNKNNNMVQIITMSGGEQISVINQNNNLRQTGWWQIQ